MTITKSWVPTRSPDPRVSVFRFRDEGTGNLLSPLAPLLDCKAPPGGVISQDVLHRHILTQTHTHALIWRHLFTLIQNVLTLHQPLEVKAYYCTERDSFFIVASFYFWTSAKKTNKLNVLGEMALNWSKHAEAASSSRELEDVYISLIRLNNNRLEEDG